MRGCACQLKICVVTTEAAVGEAVVDAEGVCELRKRIGLHVVVIELMIDMKKQGSKHMWWDLYDRGGC